MVYSFFTLIMMVLGSCHLTCHKYSREVTGTEVIGTEVTGKEVTDWLYLLV